MLPVCVGAAVEMASFLMKSQRRLSNRLRITVGFRVLVPEGQQLLWFSREIKFRVEAGFFDRAASEIGVYQLFALAGNPRAMSTEGYVCDETLDKCPQVSVPSKADTAGGIR